ncbi:helix-turn-helix domain-containing protein [Pseudomonas sp. LS-2]|uniref:helix-turn-helix domain-containing protein n=1 Tax=Pseudomonas sp. LS-2 TaxID=2315859 RepID=UPI000E717DA4|nr:helix-turn-helix domain-containing protein [Pseudomonas sp. LS-2]RJX74198.1 helix-turn-helix domain-containing protein [Pseudomonas sp. LS-2]
MALRESFGAVLQLLRTRKGLTQGDISKTVAQSHISQLESAKTSPTVEVSGELASALNVQPISLLVLALASCEGKTARETLMESLSELQELGLADAALPSKSETMTTPAMAEAERKRHVVQELKSKGLTQAQAARELGMAKTTLRRLWGKT